MKKYLPFGLRLIFTAGLLVGGYKLAQTALMTSDVESYLQSSVTHGTPDPNNSYAWMIDLFADTAAPLSRGWVIKSGTGNGLPSGQFDAY